MNDKKESVAVNLFDETEKPATGSVEKIMDMVGLSGLGSIDQMKKDMADNLAVHQAIVDFVNEHFHEGTDYGKAIDASTKLTLLKPGAEKICKTFDTHPEWFADKELWEMLGSPKGTVLFICRIVKNGTGAIIGEGRGACVIGEASRGQIARDTNGSIKIAKKRAMVDAALDAFMLSERFTQDMEEIKSFMDVKKQLYEGVQKMRSGIKSELSDNQFIRMVCDREIHKKSISTKKELDIIIKAVNNYDFSTGEKLPDK